LQAGEGEGELPEGVQDAEYRIREETGGGGEKYDLKGLYA